MLWIRQSLLIACALGGFGCTEPRSAHAEPSPPAGDAEPRAKGGPAKRATPEAISTEQTAAAVTASREASRAVLAREDLGADALARLSMARAWVRWEEAHPSDGECLPPRKDGANRAKGFARPISDTRFSARLEVRDALACARERGAKASEVDALGAALDAIEGATTKRCQARGLRPMKGHVARLGAKRGASACPSDTSGALGLASAVDRALGIESKAPSGTAKGLQNALEGLPGIGVAK